MKEGWICPRCGKVNAPFIGQCTCKSDSLTTSNFDIDCVHDWIWDGISSDTGGVVYKYHCVKCGKIATTIGPMGSIKI
nr:MAG TPA: RNA polymerase I-like protein [Caudoviricetes sp.]